jgi:hypothetical protein
MIQLFFWLWAIAIADKLGNPVWPIIVYPLLAVSIVILTLWYITRKTV